MTPFFAFRKTPPIATAGAMDAAFESERLALRPWIGPGIGVRQQFYSLSPSAWAYQAASYTWATGLTGVVHGQSVLQPLSNPYQQ